MPRILVLGGQNSGKSEFAESLLPFGPQISYFATTIPDEKGMETKIKAHADRRAISGKNYRLIEKYQGFNPNDLSEYNIFECVPLMLSNLMYQRFLESEQQGLEMDTNNTSVESELMVKEALLNLDIFFTTIASTVFVSLETGLGLMSSSQLSNQFAQTLGKINQHLANKCDEVFFVVAGQPIKIK